MSENYRDPLDELLEKHKNAAEGKPIEDEEDVVETNITPTKTSSVEDDIYGDGDDARAIEAEEAKDAAEREALVQQAKEEREAYEANKSQMPARSLDNNFIEEATTYQSDKIDDVNAMVQSVLVENGITDGYFPSDKRLHIMGDLIEEYHFCEGTIPSDKFKELVLTNWISPTKKTAEEEVVEEVKEEEPVNTSPVINITNHGDAPVTVNVDDSLIPELSETRKVEINIVTVEDKEAGIKTVVEDADIDAILSEQKTTINQVPVTLIYSGYRVVMRPMNWFDYLKMAAPTSNNVSDALLQRWTNIYEHIQSTSIGNFESLDEFLSKTKWEDQELFEWALFVATSSDVEMISYTCNHIVGSKQVESKDKNGSVILDSNGKPIMVEEKIPCGHTVKYEYNPRTTIKLEEDKLPGYYRDVHDAAVGEEALKLHQKISTTRQQLILPDSGYKIEISRSSANDYLTKKLPIISDLCEEYNVPFEDFEKYMSRNPVGSLYILCALCIDKVIIPKDDAEYHFDKWTQIRKIVDKLSNDDIQVIMQVFEKRMGKPVSFEFNNIECPNCHDVLKVLPVGNLFELMGFNLTRRLQNTEVNLIDIASN